MVNASPRMHRRIIGSALLGATLVLTGWAARAEYPERPVTYIIPFGSGGESDLTAHMQQTFFETLTGQQLLIEYKPGDGGAVGWSQLNGAPGDGYTLMGVNLPHIVLQPIRGDVSYRADDLATVYWFHYTPDAVVVGANSPFKTLQDLVDAAKANPGAVTFSGSGSFTANHIAKERFDRLAGISTAYVPFRGTGAAAAALLDDQVQAQWGYSPLGAAQSARVRLLAVATEKRQSRFPDVPTFKELGFELVSGAYRGIAVPSSTPETLRQKVSGIISRINRDPVFIEQMEEAGFAVINVPYDQVPAFMTERRAEYEAVARDMGLGP